MFASTFFNALTPTPPPYILRVSDHGHFVKELAVFRHGAYWLKNRNSKGEVLYPLRKRLMCRSAYELVEANQSLHSGMVIEKSWTPLTKQMLAWYDMLPEKNEPTKPTDPQMPE